MLMEPEALIGSWRRFGAAGPVYEVLGVADAVPARRMVMRVRVAESGEELDYPLQALLDDPREG